MRWRRERPAVALVALNIGRATLRVEWRYETQRKLADICSRDADRHRLGLLTVVDPLR